MCVIITTPGRDQRPTQRQLELCEHANPHGSGLAWLDGRRVRYAKSLTVPQIHRQLARLEGPAVVHFRIASVGVVCPELLHPFPVTHRSELHPRGTARAVLFQNGTWSGWQSYRALAGFPRRQRVSDARVAASMVARFGFDWLRRLDYCRWTLLDRDGIRRIGQWSKVGGCHYSNLHWLPFDQRDFWDALDA